MKKQKHQLNANLNLFFTIPIAHVILITAASIGVALGLQNAGVVDKIAGTLLSVSEPMGKPVFTQTLIKF